MQGYYIVSFFHQILAIVFFVLGISLFRISSQGDVPRDTIGLFGFFPKDEDVFARRLNEAIDILGVLCVVAFVFACLFMLGIFFSSHEYAKIMLPLGFGHLILQKYIFAISLIFPVCLGCSLIYMFFVLRERSVRNEYFYR